MENISEECWARIESLRHRIRPIGIAGDKVELASIDAEIIELRDFVWRALQPPADGTPSYQIETKRAP